MALPIIARDTRHGALDIAHGQVTGHSHANRKGTHTILNLRHEQQRNLHVDMDALARQAFVRIDESLQRFQQLIHTKQGLGYFLNVLPPA